MRADRAAHGVADTHDDVLADVDVAADERYFRQKIKEDSLRNVLGASGPVMRNQIYMREDFRPVVTPEPPREAGRIAWLFRAAQPPRGPVFPEYGR